MKPSSVNGQDSRSQRIMAKLKESIICRVGSTLVDSSDLERRLQEVFPRAFNCPTHPPYSLMIRTAISHLKEDNGSTEDAISDFIKLNFHDLPFAHRTILRLQLDRLCEREELAFTQTGKYVLVDDTSFLTKATTQTKDKKKNNESNSSGCCEMPRKEEALATCIPVTGIMIELSSSSSEQEQQQEQVQQVKEKQVRVYHRRQGLAIRKK